MVEVIKGKGRDRHLEQIAGTLEKYAEMIRVGEWPYAALEMQVGMRDATKPGTSVRVIKADGTQRLSLKIGKDFLPGDVLDDGRPRASGVN